MTDQTETGGGLPLHLDTGRVFGAADDSYWAPPKLPAGVVHRLRFIVTSNGPTPFQTSCVGSVVSCDRCRSGAGPAKARRIPALHSRSSWPIFGPQVSHSFAAPPMGSGRAGGFISPDSVIHRRFEADIAAPSRASKCNFAYAGEGIRSQDVVQPWRRLYPLLEAVSRGPIGLTG